MRTLASPAGGSRHASRGSAHGSVWWLQRQGNALHLPQIRSAGKRMRKLWGGNSSHLCLPMTKAAVALVSPPLVGHFGCPTQTVLEPAGEAGPGLSCGMLPRAMGAASLPTLPGRLCLFLPFWLVVPVRGPDIATRQASGQQEVGGLGRLWGSCSWHSQPGRVQVSVSAPQDSPLPLSSAVLCLLSVPGACSPPSR